MRKTGKKGFTLTELIVVLSILWALLPRSQFRCLQLLEKCRVSKNEENARAVYLAAESKLTYYRSSGQWDSFQKQIKKQAKRIGEKVMKTEP